MKRGPRREPVRCDKCVDIWRRVALLAVISDKVSSGDAFLTSVGSLVAIGITSQPPFSSAAYEASPVDIHNPKLFHFGCRICGIQLDQHVKPERSPG